jgi:hypothetical protein
VPFQRVFATFRCLGHLTLAHAQVNANGRARLRLPPR